MYVRNLRKPSGNKNVYKFASAKNSCSVLCESSLERDCCYHLEYSPDVVSYESQPQGFKFQSENKVHSYTPDFLVHQSDGTVYFIEVKPLSKTFDNDFKKMFYEKQMAAKASGIQLLLVTEEQIRNGIYLENLKIIHRYSGNFEDSIRLKKVWVELNKAHSICIQSLSKLLQLPVGQLMAIVFRLICQGKATAQLDTALDEHSVIMVA